MSVRFYIPAFYIRTVILSPRGFTPFFMPLNFVLREIMAIKDLCEKIPTNLNLRLLSKFLRLYDKTGAESYCIILLEK